MRAQWEALHAGLARSLRTLQVMQAFNLLRHEHPELSCFGEPGALVGFLHEPQRSELDRKDQLLALLITLAQRESRRELVLGLLWLGLWPALDGIYRRRLRHFRSDPEALVSELSEAFTLQVLEQDLEAVTRVAATLVRNTERRLMDGRHRAWKREALFELRTEDGLAAHDEGTAPVDSALLMRAPRGDGSELELLWRRLSPILGEDAQLVLEVAVLGDSQRTAGARLGADHDAARKRYQRALSRLRAALDDSLSHSASETRVCSTPGR